MLSSSDGSATISSRNSLDLGFRRRRKSIVEIDRNSWYIIKESIQLGMPLFFASIGVTIAYLIGKRK
ncbi:MAG: hypothetical protein SNJ33_06660 [Rikenellaceae bacterium]